MSLQNNKTNTKHYNEGKVQNLIKGIKDTTKVENILNKDMTSQEENFKKRLEERRQKKLLSTSDCTEAIETVVSHFLFKKNQRTLKKNMNRSQIIIPNSHTPGDDSNFNITDLVEKDDMEINTSCEHLDDDKLQNYEKPKINKKSFIGNSVSPDSSIANTRVSGPKHKVLIESINNSVQGFLNNFSGIFFNDIIKKYNEDFNEVTEEKYSKKFVVFKNYHSQIAEMELMMKDDDGHKESIQVIIENLEDERDKELEKIEEEYKKVLEEKQKKLNDHFMNNHSSLQMNEEKFKIEMLGVLNEIIYTKK